MTELIFITAAFALLAAFITLIEWEAARGARVFARARGHFDEHVAYAHYTATSTDWIAFTEEHLRALGIWAGHEAAHLTLRFVRFVERALSKTVRHLRARAASDSLPTETTRPFVQALSAFKIELQQSRPARIGEPPV